MRSDDDPGWRHALRGLAWMLLPGMGLVFRRRRQAQSATDDRLVFLRSVFVSFAGAVVLVGVVVLVLDSGDDLAPAGMPTGAALALVACADVVGVAGARWDKPLACESDEALAGSYTTRFFLRIAFAESAALMGFVAFILTVEASLFFLGLAGSAVGFTFAAPSSSRLARDQEALHRAGCHRSLVGALRARDAGPPD